MTPLIKPITKDLAFTANEVHSNYGRYRDGSCHRWRRNGKTKEWKTRPDDFRMPVKFGIYLFGAITPSTANDYHAPQDCPLNKEEINAS